MEIGALSSSTSQTGLMQAVGLKVLHMANQEAQQQGNGIVEMMRSAQPHLGQHIDLKA
ncbi:YjfB family protein [Paenibacillus protaetiae]|uniref:Putative motility protein n=1 Tax=Paenibacillus protaetiae TaxID=2509456 RepID=A0A4P6ERH9_9BACL|nr:YjfB family protein [Paenibacillus protaetiae]QAY65136.1 putative motility protein [Paenibacillus protaetiae]